MKTAVIMKSELGNRWDAGYHLLRLKYKDTAEKLSHCLSVEEAMEMISNIDVFPSLDALQPLTRGQLNTRQYLLRAANEYPYLALAILSDGMGDEIKKRQDELTKKVEIMGAIAAKLQNVSNVITENIFSSDSENSDNIEATLSPITDELKELLANNRFVAGVVYRDEATLVIPVRTSKMFIDDCWVIEGEDWKGVKTIQKLIDQGDIPEPRQCHDVGEPIGFVDLPGHEQNYNQGWK